MKTKFTQRSICMVLILIFLAGAVDFHPTAAAPAQDITPLVQGSEDVLVRIYFDSRETLKQIAGSLDIWEVNQDAGYVLAKMSADELISYQKLGLKVEIDWDRTNKTLRNENITGIGDFPCYEPLQDTFDIAAQLAEDYPTLVEYIDIGDSYHKQNADPDPGYDIVVLLLSNQDISGEKPDLFINGGIHAREYATPELVLRFAEWLLGNYGVDPDATWLLDFTEIHLVIQINPDGRLLAEQTTYDYKRKNDHPYGSCGVESRGVDLNRNFSWKWAYDDWGSSPDQCDDTFRGPSSASEPETQSAIAYMTTIFGDHRGPGDNDPADPDTSGIYLDMHSYGGDVMWPWGYIDGNAPDDTTMQTLGRKMAYFNGYDPYKASGLYNTNGDTTDWSYGALGIPGYTFEVGDDFHQNCSTFENSIWPDNLQSMIYSAKASHRPYQEPAGPEALELELSSTIVDPGQPLVLTARINDTRYNNSNGTEPTQNIAAAEYSYDLVHWWAGATTSPMTAQDGSWNSSNEIVTATIDTSSWSTGRHSLFVRGQDAAGNWGVPTAIFVIVMDPADAATLTGSVVDACTLDPLEAEVTAGTFSTLTDPADGEYSLVVLPDTYDVSAQAAGYAPEFVEDLVLPVGSTTTQDFYLQPLNIALAFDGESGLGSWTVQSPWALSTEDSHSPTHAFSDSPGGNYSNNRDISVTSPVIDMTGKTGSTLSFWHKYITEATYDFCYVEYSTNGGTNWTTLATYDGSQSSWAQVELPVPALDNQANARIRFRFESDYSQTYDGWHIDDIILLASGEECDPAVPPTAQFTFSPADPLVGETVQFTNSSTGDLPLFYHWDFGDDAGSSTLENPTYIYDAAGQYTVTLLVTNTAGTDTATTPITVQEEVLVDVTAIDLSLETPGTILPGDLVEVSGLISPANATIPISYSVNFGDGTAVFTGTTNTVSLDFSHTYAEAGMYPMTVKVWNNSMTPAEAIADTLDIVITAEPVDVTAVELTITSPGDLFPGESVSFEAVISPADASAPFSYSLEFNDGSSTVISTTQTISFQFSHVYSNPGTFPLTVKVWNNDMDPSQAVEDTVDVIISAGEPVDVAEVSLTQVVPGDLLPGHETAFQVELLPLETNLPVTYSIDFGDGSEIILSSTNVLTFTFTHVFSMPGHYTIVVRAWNNDMLPGEAVTDTIDVFVQYALFLPLVLR